MIVIFRLEVDDRIRRMIAKAKGDRGLATRKDIRSILDWLLVGYLGDIEYNEDESERLRAIWSEEDEDD